MEDANCSTCGVAYERYRASHRFCSDKCRYRAKDAKSSLKPPVVCRHCGASFPNVRGAVSRQFCSHACHGAWVASNPVHGPKRPVIKTQARDRSCPCGANLPHGAFLCVICRKERLNARFKAWRDTPEGRAKYREKTRNAKLRRRARKASGAAEVFRRTDIFHRDGWVCGICGNRVDRTLKWPDPMSATIDHILPLAKGGSHTRANVQAAHWICNVRKSDGVAGQAEQLRLVG